jgi:hypothetical protein
MSILENQEILNFIIKGLDSNDSYITKDQRLARKIMVELVKAGRAEFLLLRDDEVSQWWNKLYGNIQEKFDKYQEKVRMYEIKLAAYNKLGATERKILGIRKPQKPKGL